MRGSSPVSRRPLAHVPERTSGRNSPDQQVHSLRSDHHLAARGQGASGGEAASRQLGQSVPRGAEAKGGCDSNRPTAYCFHAGVAGEEKVLCCFHCIRVLVQNPSLFLSR